MTPELPLREAPPPLAVRIVFGPFGVRAGWRIALWAGAFIFFSVVFLALSGVAGVRPGIGSATAVELAAALVAGWLILAWMDRRRPGALGFAVDTAAPREVGLGFVLGGVAIALAAGVLTVAGTVRWVADTGTWPEYVATLARALLLFAVAAAAEEALFRGYAFQALVQGIGAWPAVLASSALFALAHGKNPGVDALALANIFLAGVMLAWAYLRTRSLWFATAVHLGWNWTMSAALDFPVSGLVRDTPLYGVTPVGPRWVTGGGFGPEAGVAGTLVILLLTGLLVWAPWLRESPRMRALRPLVDARMGGEP